MIASPDSQPRVLVIGPTPPPYNGMGVITENLLNSILRECFDIILFDTADGRGLTNMGRFDWGNVWMACAYPTSAAFQQLKGWNPDTECIAASVQEDNASSVAKRLVSLFQSLRRAGT